VHSAIRWIERCFLAIGLAALAVWLAVWVNTRLRQTDGERELDRLVVVNATGHSSPRIRHGDLVGRVEIPRLNVSTVVFEGTDDGVLRDGVGHLAGSPLPGEAGNVVLAAHRDTFFRPLRYIRPHDTIAIVTPGGTKDYRVDSITIVTPDHTEVLNPTRDRELTLITCYPFDWFGPAPKRFIVRAREMPEPAAQASATQ
jgi:sortase A